MTELSIGYSRVSTSRQDVDAQRDALTALGADPERVYLDHGLTGTTRARPGLREAFAACRTGDTFVVTDLHRLARSISDARDILTELRDRGVRLNLAGIIHDPAIPIGLPLVTVLAMLADFEAELARSRTREGMALAKAKGRLRGKPPKLNANQEALLVELWHGGKHTTLELAELFEVARSTVYRAIQRAG